MDGIIVINKRKGMTSFDVVRGVKKALNTKKVGHTGTLDPMAEGVLPICVGRATKFAELIMSEEKIYRAEMKLGSVTETYDAEGEVIEECEVSHITEDMAKEALMSFVKEYDQVPPIYSAIKVNGKRLYEYARKGEKVEIKSRKISIYDISEVEIDLPYIRFDVRCSKGTYIRSLCYDIGRALESGAHMTALTRLKSGDFKIEDAVLLEEINGDNYNEYMMRVEDIFSSCEELLLNEKFSKLVSNGVVVSDRRLTGNLRENQEYRVYKDSGEFLGLGKLEEKGFKIFKRYS